MHCEDIVACIAVSNMQTMSTAVPVRRAVKLSLLLLLVNAVCLLCAHSAQQSRAVLLRRLDAHYSSALQHWLYSIHIH
jgi:hypothetical protein